MHIPDGFLDPKTWASAAAASTGVISYSMAKIKEKLQDKQLPLLGVLAAFIFAAQMLNFPVVGGTSGHFLGAALAAVFLGPWAACLIMTVVLVVQCLGFADGGLTALGANIFNMGLIGGILGYYIFTAIKKILPRTRLGFLSAAAAAAWLSVVIASAACATQLAISGTSPLNIVLPAMVGVHMIIGVGEAIITTAVVAVVLNTRPDLVSTYDLAQPSRPESIGGIS